MVADQNAVRAAAEPVLSSLGLELVDVEVVGSGRARTLRLTVDRDGGIDLEALAQANGPVVRRARRGRSAVRALHPGAVEPRPRAPAAAPGRIPPLRRHDDLRQVPRSRRRRPPSPRPPRRGRRHRHRPRGRRPASPVLLRRDRLGPNRIRVGSRAEAHRAGEACRQGAAPQREVRYELRADGGPPGHRAGEGDPLRDPARGSGQRARDGLQADAQRRRGGARRDRRRERRDPGRGPGTRRGRRRSSASGTTPPPTSAASPPRRPSRSSSSASARRSGR